MIILHLTDLENPDVKPEFRKRANDSKPIVARSGRMILDLLDYLEADRSEATAFGLPINGELWLYPAKLGESVCVAITVDSPDYGPAVEGLPVMHYRLRVRWRPQILTRDERTKECSQVKAWIHEAFRW
jgi:hypothetical protein